MDTYKTVWLPTHDEVPEKKWVIPKSVDGYLLNKEVASTLSEFDILGYRLFQAIPIVSTTPKNGVPRVTTDGMMLIFEKRA